MAIVCDIEKLNLERFNEKATKWFSEVKCHYQISIIGQYVILCNLSRITFFSILEDRNYVYAIYNIT